MGKHSAPSFRETADFTFSLTLNRLTKQQIPGRTHRAYFSLNTPIDAGENDK
jgi:hypothetical protein